MSCCATDSPPLKKPKSKRSRSDTKEPVEEPLKSKRKSKDEKTKGEKRRRTGKTEEKKV